MDVHGAVCQEVTHRLKIVGLTSMTTIVAVVNSTSRAEVNASRLQELTVEKRKKIHFVICQLYLIRRSEIHTTLSMKNCSAAKCVHVLHEDV